MKSITESRWFGGFVFVLSLIVIALVPVSLCGCTASLNSNIPLFKNTTLTLVNGTDYELVVIKNGDQWGKDPLKPGRWYKIPIANWSNSSERISITVEGYRNGRLAGVSDELPYYNYGNQGDGYGYTIRNCDLRLDNP